jgi:hypothetical protein
MPHNLHLALTNQPTSQTILITEFEVSTSKVTKAALGADAKSMSNFHV